MKRLDFIRAFALGTGALYLDAHWPMLAQALPLMPPVVLVELKGGNDGLNTVIPFADNVYYALRPRLGISREKTLHLNPSVGLHPALEPLLPLWKAHQLAVIQGVGYEQPNRSHFRSIEIWETASDSQAYLERGWLASAFQGQPLRPYVSHGVVLGQMDPGPLLGGHAVMLNNPQQFVRQAKRIKPPATITRHAALKHILGVQSEILSAQKTIEARLSYPHQLKTIFPKTSIGRQFELVAKFLSMGLNVPVFKLSLGSFDTHNRQLGTHARLLKDLAEASVAFEKACKEINQWQNMLVMTYSEFGRRPKENGSQGTDHGTASVHFAYGGAVKGGLYGHYPDLSELQNADLKHHVDFKQLYATILKKHWHLPTDSLGTGIEPLAFL